MKSFEELEQEELQKIPKFKARPFNKKVPFDKFIFCPYFAILSIEFLNDLMFANILQ